MRAIVVGVVLFLVTACGQEGGAPEHPGKVTYQRYCFSCHEAGVAGAPKRGDAEVWGPRIAKGEAALLQSVTNGMPPGMPPMGLCNSCSEQNLKDAVAYMTHPR